MFREHDPIVLTAGVDGDAAEALLPGAVGTIVHIHPGGTAFVVEFPASDGNVALATVLPDQLRPATPEDLAADRFYRKAAAISPPRAEVHP